MPAMCNIIRPNLEIFRLELFSWKTTSHKDHLEVCLPNSRLLSGLIGMWSSMKITLNVEIEDTSGLVKILKNHYKH